MSLSVVAIGPVDEAALAAMGEALERTFGLTVDHLAPLRLPDEAYDPTRNQYSAPALLRELLRIAPRGAQRILGITECDLFIPMLSFLFGQAQLDGRAAIVSLARLRQSFYGLPADPERMMKRGTIEAIHEAGHTFGLIHCMTRTCPMSLATNIHQLDMKGGTLCNGCRLLLNESSSLKTIKAHA